MAEILDQLSGETPVVLAPMSGLTDTAFRCAARAGGASMLVSEMVASERYVGGEAEEALKGAEDTAGQPYVVQLAGCEASWMARAAARAEEGGAAAVDINMGCPAKRVVGGYAGSALMRDLDHAAGLIAAVKSAVSVPVFVKMRLGWDERSLNAPELAARAQDLGVAMVSVHGRTRSQFYEGRANWSAVGEVVSRVHIPVLVNGDISDATDARAALSASGAHGVMIGRQAIGNPWLLGEVRNDLNGIAYSRPASDERRDTVIRHFRASIAAYGDRKGVFHFRKHLAAYLASQACPRALIAVACQEMSPTAIEGRIVDVFASSEFAEVA